MPSRAWFAELDAALVRITGANAPITVRGVFYRAVAEGLVPKEETRGYRVVQRRLMKLRLAGNIPYGWITDGSRRVLGYQRYRDARDFADSVRIRYWQDYWRDAEEYVEVWVEKDAMSGVLSPVVIREWGLSLHVTRGFASVTYLHEAAEDIALENRPVYVYLLTDFDPSGLNIANRIEEELYERTYGADLTVERIAVTPEQIAAYSIPTHGGKAELDAFPPNDLRALVAEVIERHMDRRTLELMKMVEEEERKGLGALLANAESRDDIGAA